MTDGRFRSSSERGWNLHIRETVLAGPDGPDVRASWDDDRSSTTPTNLEVVGVLGDNMLRLAVRVVLDGPLHREIQKNQYTTPGTHNLNGM